MGQIGAKSVDINDTVRKSNTFSCTHEQLYLINTVFLDRKRGHRENKEDCVFSVLCWHF